MKNRTEFKGNYRQVLKKLESGYDLIMFSEAEKDFVISCLKLAKQYEDFTVDDQAERRQYVRFILTILATAFLNAGLWYVLQAANFRVMQLVWVKITGTLLMITGSGVLFIILFRKAFSVRQSKA